MISGRRPAASCSPRSTSTSTTTASLTCWLSPREQGLTAIPDWHFFTGPVPALKSVWDAYDVSVSAPNPNADIVHTSVMYFIGTDSTKRYAADPMADHTSSGTAYLPPGQISSWGQGIAQVARTLLP